MSREELKEIILNVLKTIEDEEAEAPVPACFHGDNCDATTKYAIGEEG